MSASPNAFFECLSTELKCNLGIPSCLSRLQNLERIANTLKISALNSSAPHYLQPELLYRVLKDGRMLAMATLQSPLITGSALQFLLNCSL